MVDAVVAVVVRPIPSTIETILAATVFHPVCHATDSTDPRNETPRRIHVRERRDVRQGCDPPIRIANRTVRVAIRGP